MVLAYNIIFMKWKGHLNALKVQSQIKCFAFKSFVVFTEVHLLFNKNRMHILKHMLSSYNFKYVIGY